MRRGLWLPAFALFGSALSLASGAVLLGAGSARAARAPERHAGFAPPGKRAPRVLSDRALARLAAEGRSVLWVHFTDKGTRNEGEFAAALREAGRRVPARSQSRRARETGGPFVPDYYDLPVPSEYVASVVRSGASVRHVSRWLNAMTVVASQAQARAIAELPFVRIITPARPSRRVEPVFTEPLLPTAPEGPEPEGTAPEGRDRQSPRLPEEWEGASTTFPRPVGYGQSTTPLTGINAIAAHDSGWSAASVIVAMFDSGYDKNHNATVQLPRIAEWDFIFGDGETANQPADVSGQWGHGTGCWSVLGGYWPSNLVGPAYNARFLLAKTEDIRSEMPIEEDNWVAAAEWADSLGADVISSSLAYLDFDGTADDYAYTDLDGYTTVVSLGAIMAARRGIVVANAMGNSGPAPGSLWAPADAESILSVGAVDSGNTIGPYSSRGPTADGRTKPEVVAQGTSTPWAVAGNPSGIAPATGTSLATPLVGGAAALVREAHPEWTVAQVREALMTTADKAATPGNDYGWGRIDVVRAIYGSSFGVPVAPRPFNILVPVNNAVVSSTPVTFRWRRTTDAQGGPLTYTFSLYSISPDSCLFMATTADSFLVYAGYLGPSKTYEWLVTATDPQGYVRESRDRFRFTTTATTGVPIGSPPAVPLVTLKQNRPNPVRSLTQIDYALAGGQGLVAVKLLVFDAAGRLVRVLADRCESVPAQRSIRWDGRDRSGRRVSSGIYYYRLEVAGKAYSKRLVLVR